MNRAERRRQQKKERKQTDIAKSIPSVGLPLEQTMNLAIQHHAAGRLPNAERIYRQILQADPDHPTALNLLGVIAHQTGKNNIAVDLIEKALTINPDVAEAHNNLGNALKALGRQNEAMGCFYKAVTIEPEFAEAHFNLGNEWREIGRLDDAVASLQKALAIKPDYTEALYNLGNTFKVSGQLDKAVASYQKALAINPDFAEAHYNLGNALKDLGRLDETIASYQEALAIIPDYYGVWNNLANVFQHLGRFDEAVECYRKVLALKPEISEAHRQIANIKKFSTYDNDIETMEIAFTRAGANDEQKIHLAFGLGKSYEDVRQYAKAFEYFLTANALKRRTYDYSIESVEFNFNLLKELFTKELFEGHKGAGTPEETPIFILGMPRSGTTLIEQILASHPDIEGAGEIYDLRHVVETDFGAIGSVNFIDKINEADVGDFSSPGRKYIRAIRDRSDFTNFITDKMPNNFQLIGMIKLILPNAKIIHCCRDPLDTCLSIFKNLFTSEGQYYAYDLNELGRYYSFYRDLMDHWHEVLPNFIFDIHYEDVILDQESRTRALLEYCGLEWDEACLEFHKLDRPVYTASFAQVRRPIYKDSVQSWKNYENEMQPLIDLLRE